MKKSDERWVNIGKCIAIIAVMTDHMAEVVYSSSGFQSITFFSVTLFILLMGVTTYWSFENSEVPAWKKVVSRIRKIVVPYIIAVFIFHCLANRGFDWDIYIDTLVHFNASGPHYYVLLYILLVLMSPIVYRLIGFINKKSKVANIVIALALGLGFALIARFANEYSNFSNVYAIRLFGGSYLLVLYIGMLIGKYCRKWKINGWKQIAAVVSSLVLVGVLIAVIFTNGFILDIYNPLGSVINPPGITLLIYAVIVMLSIYLLDKLIVSKGGKIINRIADGVAYVGKHTLYIFLYHRLFLDYFLLHFFVSLITPVRIVLYILAMIVGSIVIEKVVALCSGFVVRGYMHGGKSDQ